MDFYEKTLSRHKVYLGKILQVRVDDVELPNGKVSTREVVEHGGAVGIVAINQKNEVLLIKQYRYALEKVTLEIPAGKLEKGETPIECAKRELVEESGWEALTWEPLYTFYSSPGFTNEVLHLYKASDLIYKGQDPDEDETLDVLSVPIDNAIDMIKSGKIKDGKSIIGIFSVKLAKLI